MLSERHLPVDRSVLLFDLSYSRIKQNLRHGKQNVRHKEVDMLKTASICDVRYLEANALRQMAALVSFTAVTLF
jgi:hypothetical protein